MNDAMLEPVKTIVVVGAGTAGWLTACILAARHDGAKGQVKVRLIEPTDIPTIGVGEGTWPTMRATLRSIGLSEKQFLRACDASFKQGSKFCCWRSDTDDDFYYHPFELPLMFYDANPASDWLNGSQNTSFSEAVCFQESICEANLAPKLMTTPEYAGVANYGYHLDAGKFADLLRTHATEKLGVELIADKVLNVINDKVGYIHSVRTEQHGEIAGDLFIDCTGFRSLLLGEHFDVDFQSQKDVLFVDRAIAVQVPYKDGQSIASQTNSTAQASGWIWDIGLQSRRGVGHVYSSAHGDEDQALVALQAYLRLHDADFDKLNKKHISINSGYRKEFWKKNCVAVGLSAGFLEPIEASAIVMIENAANFIAKQFPANRASMSRLSERFNTTFTHHWERIVDFIKLHYVLSQRTEPFWLENRDASSITDRLQNDLDFWRHQPPWYDDFTHKDEVFPAASYQYVLYGMGYETQLAPYLMTNKDFGVASERILNLEKFKNKGLSQLKSNKDLLESILN